MFATEHFDVQPDIMIVAKGITSGYIPLGTAGVTDGFIDRRIFYKRKTGLAGIGNENGKRETQINYFL